MKLNELKDIWKSVTHNAIEKDAVSETTILKTIRKKSTSEISKIRSTMQFKLIGGSFATLVVLFSAVVSITFPKKTNLIEAIYSRISSFLFSEKSNLLGSLFTPLEYTLLLITLALFIIIMLHYNYKAFKKVKAIQSSSENLNSTLEKVIEIVENVMKLNVNFGTLSITLMGTWIAYSYLYRDNDVQFDSNLLYLFITIIISLILFYFIESFGQKIKFGRYVKRLKSYLKSLEQEKNN